MMYDPNGEYGVLALSQGHCRDVVWKGKVHVSLPTLPTATLRMTYYYSTGTTIGSLTNEQISYVKDNISSNLNPLVGQTITVGGKDYSFNYQIDFVERQNAAEYDLYKEAETTSYGGFLTGNYIQSGNLEGGEVGRGSQYSMIIDFPKMFTGIANGNTDGQTPIHEMIHNLGGDDINDFGQSIMNRFDSTNQFSFNPRTLRMEELNNVVNNPHFSDRIMIINE